jgi:hypothetical protein
MLIGSGHKRDFMIIKNVETAKLAPRARQNMAKSGQNPAEIKK